ncbi:MAG: terminase large subunit, partial [Defluviitaleaceae bacterium]|nr:terminase large subunit [Defluviitaleaceae bacterium]
PDNGLLPFICRLDNEDEAKTPELWVKANPSLPFRPELMTQIEKDWVECQRNPSLYSAFMTKRMNIPKGNKDTEVTDWENVKATNRPIPDLKGCTCVAGIDFARSEDFVAAGLLFKIGEIRYWISHTFVCLASADLKRIKAPLKDWANAGLLEFVDGVEIPAVMVTRWLTDKMADYNITNLGIDQFRYSFLTSELEKIGFDAKGARKNIKLVRPTNQQYAEPIINSMFLNQQIIWGDNPLMRWYTGNTKKVTSAHGNFCYDKIEPKSRKTDGFMALVSAMTFDTELVSKQEPPPILDAFVF